MVARESRTFKGFRVIEPKFSRPIPQPVPKFGIKSAEFCVI
ncbi:hypothetical protein A11S_988 [Micavibrio aeruginosavorus EPB]|uniref:Uncharacterized protein n=1 Tax=Micavibrio aeruginosavorus EPB TaxID=349215 RepID=M4VF05_9BACT|nr:hypothetical protein A11S_988 [Micavibrio aeruginosavorus EPB]